MKADFDELQFMSKRNHSTNTQCNMLYNQKYILCYIFSTEFSILESIGNGHDMEKEREKMFSVKKKQNEHWNRYTVVL